VQRGELRLGKPPMILSHALGLDRSMWDPIIPAFADTYPVLAYDHRGHGLARIQVAPWNLDDLVDDAACLIRERFDEPVVFVGLSMGGMVAQGLAIRHPTLLRATVLAHTVASYDDAARQAWVQRAQAVRAGGIACVVDMVVSRYLSSAFRAANPVAEERLRSQLLANDPQAYATSCEALATLNWLPSLHQVQCPVLVVAGRHDLGAPVAQAQRIAESITNARLEVLEHSAHLSPAEEPQALTALIHDFLSTLP
jgi:3-oxoadipate enol-lactonase